LVPADNEYWAWPAWRVSSTSSQFPGSARR
jgi:hypothetical protein